MKVIRPKTLSKENVTVVGPDAYPDWYTYNYLNVPQPARVVGERVRRNGSIYQCIVGHEAAYLNVVGVWTLYTEPELWPTYWRNLGPSNDASMIYTAGATWNFLVATDNLKTYAAGQLYIKVVAGAIDSIGLSGLEGQLLEVAVRDAGGAVYSYQQYGLEQVFTWSDYYAQSVTPVTELAITGLPIGNGRFVEIYVNAAPGGVAALGALIVGNAADLGPTDYGVTLGINDYSRKATDDFGSTTLVERAYSKRVSASMMLDNPQLTRVQQVLANLRATPTFWIATEVADLRALTVFGWVKDWAITVAYAKDSYCTLEIEGIA